MASRPGEGVGVVVASKKGSTVHADGGASRTERKSPTPVDVPPHAAAMFSGAMASQRDATPVQQAAGPRGGAAQTPKHNRGTPAAKPTGSYVNNGQLTPAAMSQQLTTTRSKTPQRAGSKQNLAIDVGGTPAKTKALSKAKAQAAAATAAAIKKGSAVEAKNNAVTHENIKVKVGKRLASQRFLEGLFDTLHGQCVEGKYLGTGPNNMVYPPTRWPQSPRICGAMRLPE